MRAIVRTTYGSPDILALREIDKPVPKENQVLVKVHSASVNPLDWHLLRGKPFLVRMMGYGLLRPKNQVLGADIAGRVEAVGSSVTQFKVGDEVFGGTMGGFAEYVCSKKSSLVFKPSNVTFEQAASVPVAALTALQGLRKEGKLQPGHHALINGASGGVGIFAVQIAKAMGAQVTGVCSTRNLEMVRSIGADYVIDYTKADYWRSGAKYDLILDCAAFRSVLGPMRALNPGGAYVLVGGSMMIFAQQAILGPLYSRKNGRKLTGVMANINQPDLAFIKGLLETGKIVPVIDSRYTLEEVPEAIHYVEQGHSRGKVMITVQSGN